MQTLPREVAKLRAALSPPETEHNWEKMDAAVKNFIVIARAACLDQPEALANELREAELVKMVIRCLLTERTRLSASTLDLLTQCTQLKQHFQPLLHLYVPTLLKLLGRTNKLYITRTSLCLAAIVRNTQLLGLIIFLQEGMLDKATSARTACLEALLLIMKTFDKNLLERKYLPSIEIMLKKGAVDKDVKIREYSKQIWDLYKKNWPERIEAFSDPLTPIIRRYLNIQGTSSQQVSKTSPSKIISKPRAPSPLKSSTSRPATLKASVKSANAPVSAASSSRPMVKSTSANLKSSQTRPAQSSSLKASQNTLKTSQSKANGKANPTLTQTLKPASGMSSSENLPKQSKATSNNPVSHSSTLQDTPSIAGEMEPLFPPEATAAQLPQSCSVDDLFNAMQLKQPKRTVDSRSQSSTSMQSSRQAEVQTKHSAPMKATHQEAVVFKKTATQAKRAPGRAIITAVPQDVFTDKAVNAQSVAGAQRAVSSSRAFKPKRPADIAVTARSVSTNNAPILSYCNTFAPPKVEKAVNAMPSQQQPVVKTLHQPSLEKVEDTHIEHVPTVDHKEIETDSRETSQSPAKAKSKVPSPVKSTGMSNRVTGASHITKASSRESVVALSCTEEEQKNQQSTVEITLQAQEPLSAPDAPELPVLESSEAEEQPVTTQALADKDSQLVEIELVQPVVMYSTETVAEEDIETTINETTQAASVALTLNLAAKDRSEPLSESILAIPPITAVYQSAIEVSPTSNKANGQVEETQLSKAESEARDLEDLYPDSLPSPCIKAELASHLDTVPPFQWETSSEDGFTFATRADAFSLPNERAASCSYPAEPLVFPLDEGDTESFCVIDQNESNLSITEKFDKLRTRSPDMSLARDLPRPPLSETVTFMQVTDKVTSVKKRHPLITRDSNSHGIRI